MNFLQLIVKFSFPNNDQLKLHWIYCKKRWNVAVGTVERPNNKSLELPKQLQTNKSCYCVPLAIKKQYVIFDRILTAFHLTWTELNFIQWFLLPIFFSVSCYSYRAIRFLWDQSSSWTTIGNSEMTNSWGFYTTSIHILLHHRKRKNRIQYSIVCIPFIWLQPLLLSISLVSYFHTNYWCCYSTNNAIPYQSV